MTMTIINESINQSINQSIKQASKQAGNQVIKQSINNKNLDDTRSFIRPVGSRWSFTRLYARSSIIEFKLTPGPIITQSIQLLSKLSHSYTAPHKMNWLEPRVKKPFPKKSLGKNIVFGEIFSSFSKTKKNISISAAIFWGGKIFPIHEIFNPFSTFKGVKPSTIAKASFVAMRSRWIIKCTWRKKNTGHRLFHGDVCLVLGLWGPYTWPY